MPWKRKTKTRKQLETRLLSINPILKASKGESYVNIALNLQGEYEEMSYRRMYEMVYNLYNRKHFPKLENGEEDYRFVRDVIRTTEKWLKEHRKALVNRIHLIDDWSGYAGMEE